jgi:hypothetical protein
MAARAMTVANAPPAMPPPMTTMSGVSIAVTIHRSIVKMARP